MSNRILHIFLLMLGLVIVSCDNFENVKTKPTAFGSVNQLNVVIDQDAYRSELWDSITYYFSAPYPILPQPEPIFDVRYLSVKSLNNTDLADNLRTYLLLTDMSDKESGVRDLFKGSFTDELDLGDKGYSIRIIDDYWAKGQLLIYIIGENQEALLRALKDGHVSITKKISEFDQDIIAKSAFMQGTNKTLSELIESTYGIHMKIPGKYQKAISNDTLTWFQFHQESSISSLIFAEQEYIGQHQFTKEYIQQWTEELISNNVQGPTENSYMVLNDKDLPVLYENSGESEYYSGELRAIWEMENAFMGGPLISKAIYKPGSRKIQLIIGFVFAPGEEKRNYLQRVEYIINQAKFQ